MFPAIVDQGNRVRRVWRDLIARAEAQQWSFHHFLATLVAEEIAQRSHTRLGRLSHRAQFPFLKTIDDFDFTYQSSVRLALLGSALSTDFVTEGSSLVLLGKPGRGVVVRRRNLAATRSARRGKTRTLELKAPA